MLCLFKSLFIISYSYLLVLVLFQLKKNFGQYFIFSSYMFFEQRSLVLKNIFLSSLIFPLNNTHTEQLLYMFSLSKRSSLFIRMSELLNLFLCLCLCSNHLSLSIFLLGYFSRHCKKKKKLFTNLSPLILFFLGICSIDKHMQWFLL